MTKPLLVFDLDGTLAETAPDLVATLNQVLAEIDVAPVTYESARAMVGGGARLMIERAPCPRGRFTAAAENRPDVRRFSRPL